jgi:DNA-binding NarL/FixJ family response regulator
MATSSAPALPMTDEQHAELLRMAGSTVLPRRVVTQAMALALAADGVANEQIARSCGVDSDTVRRWRARFVQNGTDGVGAIARGRGRRSSLPSAAIAEVVWLTQHEQPVDGKRHWSTRSMAARVGIGKDAVARIWADHELKPRRDRGGQEPRRPVVTPDPHADALGFDPNPSRRAPLGSEVERSPRRRLKSSISRHEQDSLQLRLALLRGDIQEIHRLVDVELAEDDHATVHRAHLLAGRSFASILASKFVTAYDDAAAGLRSGFEQPLFRALCALSSSMGGLERDGSDIVSVEQAAEASICLNEGDLVKSAWTTALTAEAAMSVGRLDLAEAVARRLWLASAKSDPPESIFAGQTLVRALLFQGRLEEASTLAPLVDQGAQRRGFRALRLVVRGSLAYVDALRGRVDALTRHAASIDQLASQCPAGYFVSGATVLTAYALATAQRAQEAADVLLRGAGGPQLPNIQLIDRAYGYELLVTAALSLGDIAAAKTWGDLASSLTGLPRGGMAAAAISRLHARLAVADGEVTEGAVLAEQASAMAAGNAGHLDATRAQLLAGSALLFDADDNWAARLALSTASEQALLLGATSLAVLARRDLRSIGLRLIGEPQAPMSPREREVAELLLAGASDVRIAATLHVSQRTVQSHVRRVLKALDLPSRAAVPRALGDDQDPGSRTRQLTPRQYQVADLVSRGYTNRGAARTLNVSVKTIEKHLGDVYRRLGVDSRAALAADWSRHH